MKFLLTLIISVCFSCPLFAQSDSTTVQHDSSSKYDFIIIDLKYQNQFAFWGRNYGQRLPLATSSLMYYFHSNFWVSASGFFFFDENIPTQTGLTIGYLKDLSEKIEWHCSYSQFYVPSSDIPSSSKTQGYFQTTVGVDWGILFSTLQAHVLINKNSDVFFSTYHSRYFVFNKKLWKKIQVSFEPKFSFTVGTHHFDYANALVIGPGGGLVSPNDSEDGGNKIEPLNWDFTFPLKFEVGQFSIEPSWKYASPLNTASTDPSEPLHIFTIGLNYFIPIKR